MNDIYDISNNLNNTIFDANLNLIYFSWVLFLFIVYYLFFRKNTNIKVDKNSIILKKYKEKLNNFDENYLNYDIQKFYNELNKILLFSLKIYVDPHIKDINNVEIDTLDVEMAFKDKLKNFYIHQFESNFDTDDYRKLVYEELKEIISNIE